MAKTETPSGATPSAVETATAPARAGLVLLALILVAAVANLNLSVANVALPDIGRAFDSSQTSLDLIAVGYSLGLAASVLYLGALGDRYGRKMMLVLGISLSALGPLVAGGMLQHFWWGSVFLVTLPLAALALVLAVMLVPSHVNETSDPVDNLGGILAAVMVGALIVAINFAPVPNKGALAIGLGIIALAATLAFIIRQRRARNPLYDLHV